jgi:hypothetical protein
MNSKIVMLSGVVLLIGLINPFSAFGGSTFQQLQELLNPSYDDVMVLDDVSDTTGSANGTTKHMTLQNLMSLENQNASEIATDTTNFDSNLSGTDTTVQAALDTLDEMAGGSGEVSISGTPTAGQLAEWVDSSTIQGVSSFNATITGEDYNLDWAINDNSAGDVPTDTYPGRPHETNATIETLNVESQAAVTVDVTFYYRNGTAIGTVSLSGATSGSNDITDISVNRGDIHYIETSANATTEWINAYEEGVTR